MDEFTEIPDDLFTVDIKDKNDCKGQIYKCVSNNYFDNNGSYVQKLSMKNLRRKSCKGCQYCGYLDDAADEYLSGAGEVLMDNPQDGGLYQLKITNVTTDWESGLADDHDVEFVSIPVTS